MSSPLRPFAMLLLPLLALLHAAEAAPADPAGAPAATTLAVVVHAGTPVAGLTRERVTDLLTGRIAALPDGGRVVLILSHGDGGEAAVRALTARDVSRLIRGWKRLVFGGGGSLPQTADDDAAAIELLARTPDGLLPLSGADAAVLPEGLRLVPLP